MIVDYIETYKSRFGVEPICAVLSEHGVSIAPSTYYERRREPVTDAEFEDAYLANALVTLWREEWCVSTGCSSCGTPPVMPAWMSDATRSPG